MNQNIDQLKNMGKLLNEQLAKLTESAKGIKSVEGLDVSGLTSLVENAKEQAEKVNEYIASIK